MPRHCHVFKSGLFSIIDFACRSVVALPYFISFSFLFLFSFFFFFFSFFSYRYCNDYALLCSVFAMAFDRCLIKDYLLTCLLISESISSQSCFCNTDLELECL